MADIVHSGFNTMVLNIPSWSRKYKANRNGDIWVSDRHMGNDAPWEEVLSDTRRRSIWREFAAQGKRIFWREVNGETITIPGFKRHEGQASAWFECVVCSALYTDEPQMIDRIRGGCNQQNCPNYLKVIAALEASVNFPCPHCAVEINDPNGEVDTCPACGKSVLPSWIEQLPSDQAPS